MATARVNCTIRKTIMNNKKIYIITGIVSIILIIPNCFYDKQIFSLLEGIGCSGIAASLIAFFIESNLEKKEKEKRCSIASLYLKELNSQLIMMLGRVIWFDKRMDDNEFNWELDPEVYSSLKYMLYANRQYTDEDSISWDNAIEALDVIGEKYSLEAQKKMTFEEKRKTQNMFLIIAASSKPLINLTNELKSKRIELDSLGILTIEEADSLIFNIVTGIGLMNNPGKNYLVAIKALVSAAKKVREVGGYNDEVCSGLQGTIHISEL